MDKAYADTVRLLLDIAPDVFRNEIFALKGGTAINLFVQDMPRLSVDIDVVYVPRDAQRDEAMQEIERELGAIADRLAARGLGVRRVRRVRGGKEDAGAKLLVEAGNSQVKVEVNIVLRGTVLPVERRPLMARTADRFGVEFDLPVLAPDELYAGKLVAAMDRQHPRDLFDVWQLLGSGGFTAQMVECVVVYLAGHPRPPHEILFGNDKDIAREYERAFAGMMEIDCPLETLLETRKTLRRELPRRFSEAQRRFLAGLVRAQPDWSLLQQAHVAELPAIRWKLLNLERFRRGKPEEAERQARALEAGFLQ